MYQKSHSIMLSKVANLPGLEGENIGLIFRKEAYQSCIARNACGLGDTVTILENKIPFTSPYVQLLTLALRFQLKHLFLKKACNHISRVGSPFIQYLNTLQFPREDTCYPLGTITPCLSSPLDPQCTLVPFSHPLLTV